MSIFELEESLKRLDARLARTTEPSQDSARRPRRDRGRSRLDPAVLGVLEELLQARERPSVRFIQERLAGHCDAVGLRAPARATIYKCMEQIPARSHPVRELPRAVRETLYNLSSDGEVPGHQLAFHCLNYGDVEAISFAAGLPWLALHQAARMPGWRSRSRGLLEAIRRVRGF